MICVRGPETLCCASQRFWTQNNDGEWLNGRQASRFTLQAPEACRTCPVQRERKTGSGIVLRSSLDSLSSSPLQDGSEDSVEAAAALPEDVPKAKPKVSLLPSPLDLESLHVTILNCMVGGNAIVLV